MAYHTTSIGLVLGPLLALVAFFSLQNFGWGDSACWSAAIAVICAVWWIFEPTWVDFGRVLAAKLDPSWYQMAPELDHATN